MIKKILAGFLALFLGLNGSLQAQGLTDEEKLFGLSNFWREVSYNLGHWDQVPDLDWDAAYRHYVARVLAAQSRLDYYRELQRFCALLKDGHTNVYLPEDIRNEVLDTAPVRLVEIEGKPIVANIETSLGASVPIGSELLSVDGEAVQLIIEDDIVPLVSTSAPHMYVDSAIRGNYAYGFGVLYGEKNSVASMTFRTPAGAIMTVEAKRNMNDREVDWMAPPEMRPLIEFRWLEHGIAYVAVNYFSRDEIVPAFEELLPELQRARAIVLDVRKNGGGKSTNAAKIARYFTTDPFESARWRTPKHVAAYKAWGFFEAHRGEDKKYRPYFDGHVYHHGDPTVREPASENIITVPTFVLIGRRTASAAEDFLVMGDKFPSWTYVGEPTYGSTGQPLFLDMPGGGRARISTKRDYYPDGREFIGVGVLPDVKVQNTIEDYRKGRDAVLQEAIILANKVE